MENLYQFAVIKYPTEEERKAGKRAELIVAPKDFILAGSPEEASMRAARSIPEEAMQDAGQLKLVLRPF